MTARPEPQDADVEDAVDAFMDLVTEMARRMAVASDARAEETGIPLNDARANGARLFLHALSLSAVRGFSAAWGKGGDWTDAL